MRQRTRLGALSVSALLLAGSAVGVLGSAASAGGGPTPYGPPKIKHVWNIVLENKSYEAAFTGLNQNSYLWQTLPANGLLQRQYYGTSHFSQGNYLSMISGQGTSPGPQSDCPLYNETGPVASVADGQYRIVHDTKRLDGTYNDGSTAPGCVFPRSVQTLFNQFDAARVSYRGYMQDMGNDPAREAATCGNPLGAQPGPAALNPGGSEGPYASPGSITNPTTTPDDAYVSKHNPFPWFHSLLDNGDCANRVVPLAKNLLADLTTEASTPAFSFITPNNCSDAHDATCKGDNLSGGSNPLTGERKPPANTQGGLYASDLFLRQIIPAIQASPAYQDGGMIIVNFDEGFPPYTAYGNSIADKNFAPDAALGIDSATGKSVQSEANTAQSVVACCNELHGPNTSQPGFLAFNQDTTPGGGVVGAILLSPFITPGSVTDQPYNHYSWLRSMEDLFRVSTGGADGRGHLGYAAMDGLRPFGPDVYNNPTAHALSAKPSGEGGVYAAQQTLNERDVPVSYQRIDGAPDVGNVITGIGAAHR